LGRVVESVLSEGIASLVVEEVEVASEEEAVSVELFLELLLLTGVVPLELFELHFLILLPDLLLTAESASSSNKLVSC
jgi:hypothetical protein